MTAKPDLEGNPYAPPATAPEARKWRFLARGTTARRWRFATGLLLVAIGLAGLLLWVAVLEVFATLSPATITPTPAPKPILIATIFFGGLAILLSYAGLFLWMTSFPRRSRKWRRNCLWTRALLPARFRRPRLADRRPTR